MRPGSQSGNHEDLARAAARGAGCCCGACQTWGRTYSLKYRDDSPAPRREGQGDGIETTDSRAGAKR